MWRSRGWTFPIQLPSSGQYHPVKDVEERRQDLSQLLVSYLWTLSKNLALESVWSVGTTTSPEPGLRHVKRMHIQELPAPSPRGTSKSLDCLETNC